MKTHRILLGAKRRLFGKRSRPWNVIAKRFSLSTYEQLEARTMLTASAFFGALNPGDVHATSLATISVRSLLASNAGLHSVTTASANSSTTSTQTSTANNAAPVESSVPLTTTVATKFTPSVQPAAEPLVSTAFINYRLEPEDLSGHLITSIAAGQQFQLAAFVQDVRNPPGSSDGVFAGYVSAAYDSTKVSIASNATITYGPDFLGTGGSKLQARGDLSVPGQITGAGISGQSLAAQPTQAEQLLWTIPATASTVGTVTFTPSFYSDAVDVSLEYGDNSEVTSDQTTFSPAPTLTVLANTTPVVSISNPSVSQNDVTAGTEPFLFTVTLSTATSTPVLVDFATADGTATVASGIYTATSGTLTFAPGATSQIVTVLANAGTITPPSETFSLNLSSPTNATLGTQLSAAGRILPPPTVSLSGPASMTPAHGSSGTTPFVYTVSLSTANSQQVFVNFTTTDGTATTASGDYTATQGTLTFAPSTTAQSLLVTVPVTDLTINEATEDFTVSISSPVNAISGASSVDTQILNDIAAPSLSIADVTQNNVTSGTTNFVFTVSLSAASEQPIAVDFATADDTAIAGTNYNATSGTLSFAPNTTSQLITVVVHGSPLNQPNEDFKVNLSSPTIATIAKASATGEIINTVAAPALSITPSVSHNEGNAGTTAFVFTATLSTASGQAVNVQYATTDGTATVADNDYQQTSGTLTFAAGTTTQLVTVLVNGDTKIENDETFSVSLSSPTNATITSGSGSGIGTIVNDDFPVVSIPNVTQTLNGLGTTPFVFTVTLSAAAPFEVDVPFATQDDTATVAGGAYAATSGTLTFAAGTTSQIITVLANAETVNEANEDFKLALTQPANANFGTGTGIAEGVLVSNVAEPSISISSLSQNEGNSGTTPFVFSVTLSAVSGQQITVAYTTADGTAQTSDGDYAATSGTLTFAPNTTVTTQLVTVLINGNTIPENDETFSVDLSGPTNATIGTGSGLGTIKNDDSEVISITSTSAPEGNSGTTPFLFTVSISPSSASEVDIPWATGDGTATAAANDYQQTSGTLTFAAGTTSQIITVLVNGDTTVEPNENFSVNLNQPSGTSFDASNGVGVGTILNDDGQFFSITTPPAQDPGTSGTTDYFFTVSIGNASTSTVTVDYSTADGSVTAASGAYQSTSGTLTFAPGTTLQLVTVLVNGRNEFNPPADPETFLVNLSNPSAGTLEFPSATATILNSVAQPSVSINNVTLTDGTTTTPFVFTATLSGPVDQPVTVQYATTPVSPATGNLAPTTSGTLTFAPGTTSQLITVQVAGTSMNEPTETFNVNLSSPTLVTLGTSTGLGTILNAIAEPTLSIGNVSQNEGNSGTTAFVFTATLSAASGQQVTAAFTTADGTATTADGDYNTTSGTLTFAPGTTAQLVTVLVVGDTKIENTETFSVNLSNPTNATIATGTANGVGTGTIVNDDFPVLNIPNVTQTLNNSGTTPFLFTVTLSAPAPFEVDVPFATQDDTATVAAGRYAATSGTLTFAAGTTSQIITVLADAETVNEANEDFKLALTQPANANFGTGTGVAEGVLISNVAEPTISIGNVSQNEGNSGTTPFVFTATLSAASGQQITAAFTTADGTATTADTDYAATSGTLTFAPGTTSQLITVLVNGDTKIENNETFSVNLSGPTNATIPAGTGAGSATGTIVNDDFPVLSIPNVTQTLGTSGTTPFLFTVTLSAPAPFEVDVPFATQDDTATVAAGRYAATSGTLTFAAGTTSQVITVLANAETVNEANEDFKLALTQPANATFGGTGAGVAEGVLISNVAEPTISIGNVSQNEGNSGTSAFVFTASLSAASGQQITAAFTTADGTATTADTDYSATSGTLTFAAGTTSQLITVLVNGDTKFENNEAFSVNLSGVTNATPASASATGTIVNDDTAPTLSIGNASGMAPDTGTTPFVFTVSLSAASGAQTTVAFATADGSGIAGTAYTATSGTLTFAPGTTTENVTVQVLGTLLKEPSETFLVNLSGPTNATLQTAQGTGTIQVNPNHTATLSSLAGVAFVDVNNDGKPDNGEKALAGLSVTLSGTSTLTSSAVSRSTSTASDGSYSFANLDPGTYTVTFSQPANYLTGKAIIGSEGGTVSGLSYTTTISSTGGVAGTGNDFTVLGLQPGQISQRSFLSSTVDTGTTAAVQTAAADAAAQPSAMSATADAATTNAGSAATDIATTDAATPLVSSADVSSRSTLSSFGGGSITQSGNTVTVHGSSGNDNFAFTAGSVLTVTLNGVTRQFDPASINQVVFDGGGGKDTATLTGSSGADVANLGLGSGTLSGANYKVSVSNVTTLSVHGGGGHDTATLQDSALSDFLQASGDGATITNDAGLSTSLAGFAQVQAISSHGGTDKIHVGATDFALEQEGSWLHV